MGGFATDRDLFDPLSYQLPNWTSEMSNFPANELVAPAISSMQEERRDTGASSEIMNRPADIHLPSFFESLLSPSDVNRRGATTRRERTRTIEAAAREKRSSAVNRLMSPTKNSAGKDSTDLMNQLNAASDFIE
jgi:hypothetical protein